MAVQNHARTSRRAVLWVFLGIVVLLVAAGLCIHFLNPWSITLTMEGQPSYTLEYGETFEDPGATATLSGTRFFRSGLDVEVTSSGKVDTSKLGTYTITYHASRLFCSAEAQRTVTVQDTTPPVITLNQVEGSYTIPGTEYEEEGFSATDSYDGDLTDQVERVEQDGVVTYTVTDSSGNQATATREINYDDPIPPELTLLGDSTVTITAGTAYTDPGWDASDNVDGDLTDAVEVTDTLDVYLAGTYTLTYSVTDSYGNTTTAERTVNVQAVPQPDVVMPNGKIIYLTFDDGPGPYTEDLLAVLAKYNVKVTFFTVNTKYISLVKEEIEAGHSVGIHSATHDYAKIYTSEDAYFADLKEQQDIIYNLTGVKTTLIRFPGGSSNAVSKHYCTGIMTKLTQAVTDQGFQYFDWNVTSGDAGETTSTDKVFENVVNGVKNRNVSIVLQHDIKKFSVDAVEKIITWGLANGYTFLPLDSTSPTAHHSVNN
jgi:peptidoglycan/xylan/chitin deacetylase (PgdA/CDA1 family)